VADQKLVEQIAQEFEEIKNAPKIPIIPGQVFRCHLCGGVFSANNLRPFDTHIPERKERVACPNCHPDRSTL